MSIQYFKSAWGDIKNSPGWFGKLCLLALVNFIPIFGQIVTIAYLYGWAREIAWGTHEPMPEKIFDNSDGKFWRRGWFVFVIQFVFILVPNIVISLGGYWQGLGYTYSYFQGQSVDNPVLVGFGGLLVCVGYIGVVLCGILAWIGAMRASIYDRLSSGFQIGKLWKMLRHDVNGIARIFGMELLFGIVLGIILSIVAVILMTIVIAVGVAGLVHAGYGVANLNALQYMTNAQALNVIAQFVASAGVVGFLSILVLCFMGSLVVVFVDMLVVRALGYWTMRFDVPRWGGQDDPMPFELEEERAARQQTQAQSWQRSDAEAASSVPEPVVPAAPVEPIESISTVPSDVAPSSEASVGSASDSPKVTYDKPIEVPASFIMPSDEAGAAEAEAPAAETEPASAAEPAESIESPAAPEGFTVSYTSSPLADPDSDKD